MTTPTIALRCAGCSAPLEITGDMETFACGYCGLSQVVERKGGTIALRRMEASIGRVQRGTDKTAAELALVRLAGELAAAESAHKLALQSSTVNMSAGELFMVLLCAVMDAMLIWAMLKSGVEWLPATFIVMTIPVFWGCFRVFRHDPSKDPNVISMKLRVAALKAEIANNRRIVQS